MSKQERRTFLSQAGAGLVGLAAGVTLPATAQPAKLGDVASPADYDESFRQRSHRVRAELAKANAEVPIPPHPTNGDEERYPNKIGSDSRALPHNDRGEVDLAAWKLATTAFATREPADFEKIPLGGARKLLNPVGTLAVSLDGLSAAQFGLPPAPQLASTARASEAIEIY